MNYLEKMIDSIMEENGLVYGDEFYLNPKDSSKQRWLFRFSSRGMEYKDEDNSWILTDSSLCQLARGQYTIEKTKFIPRKGGTYFYIDWPSDQTEHYVTQTEWDGGLFDVYNLAMGNCFRSPQAAAKKENEMYKHIMETAELT